MDHLIKLNKLPAEIVNLQRVRDLLYFDGPLLSEYRNASGDTYLYMWAGVEPGKHHKWLVFRVNKRDLVRYLYKKITLRQLVALFQGGFAYVLHISNAEPEELFIAAKDEIPSDMLPGERSFYDSDRAGVDLPDEYAMLIGDEDWEFSDLGYVPRKYLDIHAFLYWMGHNDHQLESHRFFNYKKDGGGYVVHHLFSALKGLVPQADKPHLKEIHLASPGFISMHMDPDMGHLITMAVAKVSKEITNLNQDHSDLQRWYLGKIPMAQSEVIAILSRFVEAMEFVKWDKIKKIVDEIATRDLGHQVDDLKNLTFFILAYYRVVRELAKLQIDNKVMLL